MNRQKVKSFVRDLVALALMVVVAFVFGWAALIATASSNEGCACDDSIVD